MIPQWNTKDEFTVIKAWEARYYKMENSRDIWRTATFFLISVIIGSIITLVKIGMQKGGP